MKPHSPPSHVLPPGNGAMRMAIDRDGFLVPVVHRAEADMTNIQEERLVKKTEAARLLAISLATVNRMLKAEKLPRRQINGSVRIPLSAIHKMMGG